MAKTSALTIRIDPAIKDGAAEVFDELGMTVSEAITLYFRQVVLNGGLPFELKLPRYNAQTVAAMREAETLAASGEGFTNVDDMLRELNDE